MSDVVLVVAADMSMAQGLERALRAAGLEVVIADQAETAMVAMEYEKPAAVILENDLPDAPGLTVVKQMREREEGKKIPLVLLAGPMMPARDLARRATDQGADLCVDITVDRRALADAVKALLGGDSGPFHQLAASEAAAGIGEGTGEGDLRPVEAASIEIEVEVPTPAGPVPAGPPPRVESDGGSGRTEGEIIATAKPDPRASPAPAQPRSGSLDAIPFGLLLAGLWKDRATGQLDLHREKVKKSIWLKDGLPVTAKSNAMGETLGAVLVKMGKITDQQRAESIEKSQKEKRLHGDVLVELGLVRPKDVQVALTAQTRAKVINCFAWDEGSYSFKPTGEAELPKESPQIKMSFPALVLAGVKQRYDLPRLRKALHPYIGQTPRFIPREGPWLLEELKLEEAEKKLLEGLHGRRSLAEVLALSDLDEAQLHRILVTAHLAGAITFAPEGPITHQLRIGRELAERERSGEHPQATSGEKTPPPQVEPTLAPGQEEDEDETEPPGPAARPGPPDQGNGGADAGDEAKAILNAEHQFLKGERLLKSGNLAKAHEAFKAAVDLYPKESEYRASYGWSLFKLGHPDDPEKMSEGEKLVREALAANPRNDKAHYFLGSIALLRSDDEEARRHLQKALELNPDHADAQRELKNLDLKGEGQGGGLGGLFRKK